MRKEKNDRMQEQMQLRTQMYQTLCMHTCACVCDIGVGKEGCFNFSAMNFAE